MDLSSLGGATRGNEHEATELLRSRGINNPSSGLVRWVAHGVREFSAEEASRFGLGGGDFGLQKILDEFKKRQEERNRLTREFEEKNPFVFDEVLAQKAIEAAEQLDPFYRQTLNDFLEGIRRQRTRGIEDERRLLGELETDVSQFTQENKANLELALERAREGSAQAGLLQSGLARRAEGLLERESDIGLRDFLTTAGRRRATIERDTRRSLEDIQRTEALETRDIERERQAQVKLLGSQLTKEAGIKREFARRQFLGPFADEGNTGDILAGLQGLVG